MATRNEYQKKVERHIKDLAKRAIDPSLVTQGRESKSLGWNAKSYNSFMERKRIAIRKQQKEQRANKIVFTNTQGYDYKKKEFDKIKKLQDEYNKKLQQEYKKFIKKHGNVDEITEAFLKGKPLRHKNGGENIQLQEHFGEVNLLNRINGDVDLKEFAKLTKEKIKNISYENMFDDYSDYFEQEMLKPLVDSLDLHTKESNILLEMYKKMNIVERSQFNKDMKRVMAIIESDLKNPKSTTTPYYIMRTFMENEYKREFLESY